MDTQFSKIKDAYLMMNKKVVAESTKDTKITKVISEDAEVTTSKISDIKIAKNPGTYRNFTGKIQASGGANGTVKNASFEIGPSGYTYFNSGTWLDGTFSRGTFIGTFAGGKFKDGGIFYDGKFTGGIFNGGTFDGGEFDGGTWIKGEWSNTRENKLIKAYSEDGTEYTSVKELLAATDNTYSGTKTKYQNRLERILAKKGIKRNKGGTYVDKDGHPIDLRQYDSGSDYSIKDRQVDIEDEIDITGTN